MLYQCKRIYSTRADPGAVLHARQLTTVFLDITRTLSSQAQQVRPDLYAHNNSFSSNIVADVLSLRRSVTCSSSSTSTKQPLSVYKWPQRRTTVLDWLDQCVQDAVRQLDRAPFVQLMYSERADPLETHHVSRTETGPADVSRTCVFPRCGFTHHCFTQLGKSLTLS